MPGLTERQLDLYKQQGFLLIEDVFDPSLFDTLKEELDVMVSAGAERAVPFRAPSPLPILAPLTPGDDLI